MRWPLDIRPYRKGVLEVGCLLGLLSSCGGRVEDNESQRSDSLAGCMAISAKSGWINAGFPAQDNKFRVQFGATPSANNMDGVMGLSKSWADAFGDLAASIRFAPGGALEARSSEIYSAVTHVPYAAGSTYRIRLELDTLAKKYSAWVTPPRTTTELELARDYTFRSEQTATPHLDNLGQTVASAFGAFSICNLDVQKLPACRTTRAGGAFDFSPFPQQMGQFTLEFDASASIAPIDAPIGVQGGEQAGYTNLAVIVRFNPAGTIDARNGGGYMADRVVTYVALKKYQFKLSINAATERYSVSVTPEGQAPIVLASDYAFRTEQQRQYYNLIKPLDRVASVVASPSGALEICNLRSEVPSRALQYLIRAEGYLAPTPAGDLIVSSEQSSSMFDPSGRLRMRVPYGGLVSVDAKGYISIAGSFVGEKKLGGPALLSSDSRDVYVARYLPNWVHLWSRKLGTPDHDSVAELVADPSGNLVLTSNTLGTVKMRSDGSNQWSNSTWGSDVAVDPLGNVLLVRDFEQSIDIGNKTHIAPGRGIVLIKFSPAGAVIDSWSFHARADADHPTNLPPYIEAHNVSSDRSGNMFVSGKYTGYLDFGSGKSLYWPGGSFESPPTFGFLVKLTPHGMALYAVNTEFEFNRDLVVDSLGRAWLTGTKQYPAPFLDLVTVDASGTQYLFQPSYTVDNPVDVGNGQGQPFDVAVDASRLYWTGEARSIDGAQGGTGSFTWLASYTL